MIAATLLLLGLALLGAPLFAVIAAGALLGFQRAEVDLSVAAIELYRLAEMPVMVAIPLFTFAGYLLSESGAPSRLLRLSNALLGWLPGGLAVVALSACALFTAFTGASGVTIVALGALLYPALQEAGYRQSFNLGLLTTSGSLGLLFAPSLPIILYGVVVQQLGLAQPVSIDELFLAGILPGLLMLALLAAYSMMQPLQPAGRSAAQRIGVRAALRESAWEIPLPIVVLGGIYSGYFAVSEAAAVTALYALIVTVGIKREVTLRRLPAIMREAMITVGGILIILGASLASTNYLIDAGIPARYWRASAPTSTASGPS